MTTSLARSSGLLLHPTSLPGRHGIGDLGHAALEWIDFLAATGTSIWQILPLGPTGYGDSPYQCFSAFAGNPYLISPEALVDDGLLMDQDLADCPEFAEDRIDYGAAIPWKVTLLDRAYARYLDDRPAAMVDAYRVFRDQQQAWVEDFGVFMAIKDLNHLQPWWTWERDLRFAEPETIARFKETERDRIDRHVFRQFLFFRQWSNVRDHAAAQGVKIVGDIPIFVAPDSADVWANPELFTVNEERTGMEFVAGVPPDYFSETGQLWGNPLYRWERHAATGYSWWLSRLTALLTTVDIVRVDHFRGFADYWEIPAGAPTAETGRWRDGPGMGFFDTVSAALGELPIIAEDLGELSPKVPALLRSSGFPGMRVLQFGFDSDERDDFLPHNYPTHCVAYTGTHDNDTAVGWWNTLKAPQREWVGRYLTIEGDDISGALNEGVWQSRAAYAITPLQTLLRLGAEARTNRPGIPGGNWQWRFLPDALTPSVTEELRSLNARYDRAAD